MELRAVDHASPATKFEPPRLRPETVPRRRLTDQLRRASAPLTLVTGPAGSGKSVALAQWFHDEPHAVWMSLDDLDNDPVVFWSSLINGLDHTFPGLGARIRRLILTGEGLTADGAIAAVVNALAEHGQAARVLLDDAHLLHNEDLAAAIPLLAQRLPVGCRLIVASRTSDPFRVAKLRFGEQLFELDVRSLAMSDAEAGLLLTRMGIQVSRREVTTLHGRTEGWIAGLLLAAQLLKQQPDVQAVVDHFDGSDRRIAEYLIDEVIERLAIDDRTFLLRTAILPRLTGDLCDAVSGMAGGAERLERLERANAFVIPLDRQRRWYRYHHLFAELLVDLLAKQHPDEIEQLHRRASEWCRAHGSIDDAIDHALLAGMRRDAADLLAHHWLDLANTGRVMTARRLLEQFTSDEITSFPPLALTAAWVKGVIGEPEVGELLALADQFDDDEPPPDGSASMASAVALARSVFGRDGVARSLADAELAYSLESPESRWRPMAAWLVADRHIWRDDWTAAKPFLDEVVNGPVDQGPIRALAFAMLALWHLDRGETSAAVDSSDVALRLVEDGALGDIVTAGSVYAIHSRVAHAAGDDAQARASLAAARGPVLRSDRALPLGGIHAKVLLAEAALAVGDLPTALENVARARAVVATVGDSGAFTDHLDAVRRGVAEATSTFSVREVDVIEQLPTDRTNAEICDALFVSRNTLKSHLRRIYQKLGVSSRAAAVDELRRRGLVRPQQGDPNATGTFRQSLQAESNSVV